MRMFCTTREGSAMRDAGEQVYHELLGHELVIFGSLIMVIYFAVSSFSSASRLLPLVSGQRRQRKMKAQMQMPL